MPSIDSLKSGTNRYRRLRVSGRKTGKKLRGAGILYDRLPRKRSMNGGHGRTPKEMDGYGFLNARVSSVAKAKANWHALIDRIGADL